MATATGAGVESRIARRGQIAEAATAWSRAEAGLLLAALGGLLLRVYQIPGQILADDEWHALYALHLQSYAAVVSHFGEADYSIPLTLFYKTLAETVGLTEMAMRAPMLLCGVATIVALPLLARRYVGRPASLVFAWLLAIAPLHVYFSRYARPYAITMLLAVVAVVAFFEWSSTGARCWAATYAGAAVVAPYFHLAVLPAVLAPLLFALTDWAVGRALGRRRPLGPVLAVGGIVAAGLTALLIAPLIVDARSLVVKAGKSRITPATVKGAWQLLAGSADLWVVAGMALLVLAGALVLARRAPRLVLYFAFLAACQLAIPLLSRPAAIAASIVLARYSLPLLPVFLVCAAVGLVALDGLGRRAVPAYPHGALPAAAVVLLFGLGPLPAIYYYPNNWTNHALFQYEYDESSPYSYVGAVRPRRVSPFYRQLAAHPAGALLIVEAPWYYAWHENPYPFYQAVHRQRMQVGFVGALDRFVRPGELPILGSGIRPHNAVHVADAAKLRKRGVRYVIFHRSLRDELPLPPNEAIDVGDWIRRYAGEYGPPVYEDADITVFDVARPAG